jgi:hypothetical protein
MIQSLYVYQFSIISSAKREFKGYLSQAQDHGFVAIPLLPNGVLSVSALGLREAKRHKDE